MTRLILIGLLFVSVALAVESSKPRIASLDASMVEGDIRAIVLARPENKDLRDAANQAVQGQKDRQAAALASAGDKERFMAAMKQLGPGSIEFMEQERQIKALVRKALVKHIDATYAGQFAAIFLRDYSETLIYTQAEVVDLTPAIKQALLTDKF